MVKFVKIMSDEYVNPQNVETVGLYGSENKVGIKMRSGEMVRVGNKKLEEVVALLEGRDG